MKSTAIVMVLLIGVLTASGVQAEIYSWTDENGIKHYSHTPPPAGTDPDGSGPAAGGRGSPRPRG